MASPTGHQTTKIAGAISKSLPAQEARASDSKEIRKTRMATEELKRMFDTYEGPTEKSDEAFKDQLKGFFNKYAESEFGKMSRPREKKWDTDASIGERLTALQKRTTETLHALEKCKKEIGTVVLLDMKPPDNGDPVRKDKRSLHELTEELRKLQIHEPSKSNLTPIERSDIDEMRKATHKVMDELERISVQYDKSGSSRLPGGKYIEKPQQDVSKKRE